MGQILNATLAGGVAMGSCADILYDGWVAYLVGSLTGIISTLCFRYCPGLLDKCGIHDVAGVFNLHGIPGLISGFLSAIFRAKYIDNKGGNQAAGTIISWAFGLFGGLAVGLATKCFHDYDSENSFFNDKCVVELEHFVVDNLSVYGHHSSSPIHLNQESKGPQLNSHPVETYMNDREMDRYVPDDETHRPKHHANNTVNSNALPPLDSDRQYLGETRR